MKKLFIFFLLLPVIFSMSCSNGKSNQDTGTAETQIRFVSADAGLRMRDAPHLDGNQLCIIPFNTEVKLLEESGEEITISGAAGKWSKVEWNGKQGWVFGGFLSESKVTPAETEVADEYDISPEEVIGKTARVPKPEGGEI
jgi:hypothetical protein